MKSISKIGKWMSLFFVITFAGSAVAQQSVTINGKITDGENKETLVGVNIYQKDKIIGTTSDAQGNYSLTLTLPESGKTTLVFKYIGFGTIEKEINAATTNLDVGLERVRIEAREAVISASRVSESILESPVSIEKMNAIEIKNTPTLSFYEGLASMKAVDMTTSSLGFKTVNSRGFNSTGNVKFVQRIDGMDNQAPGLNFSVGNIIGISDLDLESVELIPGAASALYGPNAFNGIMNMTSKSPFKYPGLSVQLKSGMNHVDGTDTDPSPLFETMLRYAKVFNNKAAFKVNFSYMRAEDWYANDTTDVDLLTPLDKRGANNPGRDGLNIYGDEVVTNLPIGPGGTSVRVSRTGYLEKDLVDYGVKSLKLDGAFNYRVASNAELSLVSRFGAGTTVYQGANRYSISDFTFQQHKIELTGSQYFLRAYATIENSGDSYDSRFLAWNMNNRLTEDRRTSNAEWFNNYTMAYLGAISGVTPGNHAAARAYADKGRLLPGTPEFDAVKSEIAGTDDFTKGAKFNDQSKLYAGEGQYDFSSKVKVVDLLVGGNYRMFDLNSNGTIFPDTAGNDITIYEYGAYTQIGKKFMEDKLRLTGSIRYDKAEQFDGQFTPRIAAVYSPIKDNFIRASYQTGFRMPSTQEQFIFLDIGAITLVGGIKGVGASTLAYENSYTLSSVQAFAVAVGADVAAGVDATQAVINRKGLLKRSNVAYIKPEQVQSFDIGYKTILKSSLYIDINYHYNTYTDLVVLQRVVRPDNLIDGPDGNAAPFDIAQNKFKAFQLYTNLDGTVASHGIAFGANYYLPKNYQVGLNYTYSKFLDEDKEDNSINGFNTPEHKVNLLIGNKRITPKLGFNVAVRWIDEYNWEASFGEGVVPSYTTVDAQMSYKIPEYKTTLKVGAANLLNNRHIDIYGGPTVGGLYFVSLSFDELFN